jgi:hypothetical protein
MKALVPILVLASFPAFSQTGSPQCGEQRRGPPPEALKACEAMKAGDACSFTGPPGKMEGSCFTPGSTKPLACRPKDAPKDGPKKSS